MLSPSMIANSYGNTGVRPPHLGAGFVLRAIAGAAVADDEEPHRVLADRRLHVAGRRHRRRRGALLSGNDLAGRGEREQGPANDDEANG